MGGCCGSSRLCRRSGCGLVERHGLNGSLSCSVRVNALNLPCTDGVEPTALVLVCVDVETYAKLLACLYVEQLDFVSTEHIETATTRILFVSFYDVILRLPLRASPCRNSFPCRDDCYDFTFYFHKTFVSVINFFDCEISKILVNKEIFAHFFCFAVCFFVFLYPVWTGGKPPNLCVWQSRKLTGLMPSANELYG